MTFDGLYAYHYDAWGRLVQINEATVTAPGGPTDPVVLNGLVKRYAYDGHGRLVQTESPRPDATLANAAATNLPLRVERFYYDGIRRVQEVVQDVAAPNGNGTRLADSAWLEREYIWGPGDSAGGPGGVDELLAQFAGSDTQGQGNPWWPLQDAKASAFSRIHWGLESPKPPNKRPRAPATPRRAT